MMKNKKVFDAVNMMRDIRNKHHKEYAKNPELREKRLVEIRKKYFARIKNKEFFNRGSAHEVEVDVL